ncbi:N-acetylglucosamine-6-phosphate deacetylase [Vibrio sp. DW001]|uniref:N-acetylglucosamine-6-phosphate deacetylase n=1 Tax=Vibrio sp. DW001 TaxID=2912315 RepID=UPI0023B0D37C|nr:N-acetylglucosamine-6-phosphate deacetylase [Vibrio sp. DW001]WED29529.1 N-acetylglucosamine-6-phosphate deacetylase [Vibrio sp. DW001]
MTTQAIVAKRIFDGTNFHLNSALVWDESQVVAIIPTDQLTVGLRIHHFPDCTVTPGFIDLQVNGGGGVMFNQQTDTHGVKTICDAHRRHGTAYLLPTLVSDTPEKMNEALCVIQRAVSEQVPGVLGIHLEGPWLNPVKRGAHFEKFIYAPDITELERMPWLTNGKVLVTLAPECVKTESIEWLKACGITVSCGHSNATAHQLSNSIQYLSGFTHLFNAMSPLTGREQGVVGVALAQDNHWCSIIADGVHVASNNVLLSHKIKPDGKLIVVTDAMATLGDDRGHFVLGEETIYVDGNKLVNGEGNLVGAHIGLDESLANLIRWGIEEVEAIKMVSTYPAHAIGMNGSLGYLKPHFIASATIFNEHYQTQSVLVDGQLFEQ